MGKVVNITFDENPEKNLATEIIASDGVTLGKFYKENRTPVQFEDLPEGWKCPICGASVKAFKPLG